MATDALERAKVLFASHSDETLRYVALELRLALEFITYDRAQAYQDEIPREVYETWQPSRLMQILIEIDPYADQPSSISLGIQEDTGIPAKDMKFLGTDNALSLEKIRKNYSALGSYLHSPTLKQQTEIGTQNFDKLRERAKNLIEVLETVLSSEIWNVKFGPRLTTKCNWCGATIIRRVKGADKTWTIRCLVCGGLHRATKDDEKRVKTYPLNTRLRCLSETCGEAFYIGSHEVRESAVITCPSCNEGHVIQLGVSRIMSDKG
jgi:hypothetical protein